ncbi:Alpha/Beta hydrolase protein [Leptodontidium sp. MPI-SDFR-AT-0119]|nr:Alpha/Beta hydrolase protein [Leptodontidium sp. MPI-SDFR-AT-0119]
MADPTHSRRLLSFLAFFASFSSSIVATSTKHGSLGGGLTILSCNDLENSPKSDSGAILLGLESTFESALSSCKLINESLWAPKDGNFFNGAINAKGKVTKTRCDNKLPALCTQSAPVSTFNTSDPSEPFQITKKVGRQSLTGYRDFYVWKFFGARYAAKPERYSYSTVFDGTGQISALSPGADCIQRLTQVKSGTSEDCLFLNIWTPYLPPPSISKKKLKPNTDGTNLASRGDVVVVALNYRVASFGFLAFADGVHNGNYGIGDVVTALEWFARNIKDFGGDPDRVTIFGESAGASVVRALLASPKAKGLFSKAIMQSGPSGWSFAGLFNYYMPVQNYFYGITANLLNMTGCLATADQVGRMRALDANLLVQFELPAQFPVQDDTYLVSGGLALNNSGGYTKDVAVMTGINRNDDLSIDFSPLALALSSGLFDIPASPTTNQIHNIAERVMTDGLYRCLEMAKAYSVSKHGVFSSLYSFQFNRTYSPTEYVKPECEPPKTAARPFGDPDQEYYKCHGGEQLLVFGNIRRELPDRDGLDVTFEQLVVDYWSSFAWSGNPNPDRRYLEARGYYQTLAQTEKTGRWKQVDVTKPAWRLLQWNGDQVSFSEKEQCQALGFPLDYYENH